MSSLQRIVEIGPLNSVRPPNCLSCRPQTSASGFSSERSAVDVTGRGYAHAGTACELPTHCQLEVRQARSAPGHEPRYEPEQRHGCEEPQRDSTVWLKAAIDFVRKELVELMR